MTNADMLQVCHMVGRLGSGGRESLLLDIIRNSNQRVNHTVCALDAGDPVSGRFERVGAPVFDADADSPLDIGALVRVYRFLRVRRFDVLHAHGPTSQVPGRVLALATGTDAVVSTHHIVREEHERWMDRFEHVTRPLDSATVAVSRDVRESYSGGKEWRVIRNGIDVESFRAEVEDETGDNARKPIPDVDPVFLNVGRYIPQKAQADLIEAMSHVVEFLPSSHLYVVGGRGDLADDIRETARANDVADSVSVTGHVPSVAKYFARADVYVSSSLAEGLPIVLLEAMAAGLPVVATDVPGNRAAVVDGETGILVPPRDPLRLARAMMRIAAPETRERLAVGGRERVREVFSIERTANEYVSLYRDVVGHGSSEAQEALSQDAQNDATLSQGDQS